MWPRQRGWCGWEFHGWDRQSPIGGGDFIVGYFDFAVKLYRDNEGYFCLNVICNSHVPIIACQVSILF